MILLDTLDVNAYRMDELALSWSYQTHSEDLSDYTLCIYRSEAPISGQEVTGYTIIASGLGADTVAYVDTSISGYFHHNRDWYYKLKIINNNTLEESIQPEIPGYLNKAGVIDRAYLEVLRRKTIALTKKTKRVFYLLKRYTMGTRCPDCWDPISFRVTESDCNTCHGTGWLGGYFSPIQFEGMTNDSPNFQEITMFGNFMPSDSILFLLNFPLIKSMDIVVDDNNDRWVVQDVRAIRKLNKIIEQKVHLALIMADDPLYNIVVY